MKLEYKDVTRYWSKVSPGTDSECWIWLGSKLKRGYGRFWLNRRAVLAHRVAYYLEHGELSDDLEIDHKCRFKDCVNPHHLEAVFPIVNRERRIKHYKNKNKKEKEKTMVFEIEKGIPCPPPRGAWAEALSELEVGDSFFLAGKVRSTAMRLSQTAKKKYGMKLTMQQQQDDEGKVTGFRLWRIE